MDDSLNFGLGSTTTLITLAKYNLEHKISMYSTYNKEFKNKNFLLIINIMK